MVIEMLLLSPATSTRRQEKKNMARCKPTDDLLSSLGCCCVAYLRVGAEQLLIPLYLQHRQRNKECRQENKQLKWKFRLKAQLQKDETKQQFLRFWTEAWIAGAFQIVHRTQERLEQLYSIKLSQLKSDGQVIWSVNSHHHGKRNRNQIHPKIPKISYEFLNPRNLWKWETWGNQNFVVLKWKIC